MKFAYLIEPPFNYLDDTGRVTGCDVELARYVYDQLGIAPFDAVETEFAALLPGLADGRWRMTTGLFATNDRRKKAAFSHPIWALPDGILVRSENPCHISGYASLAANAEARLGVIRDQVQHQTARDFGVSEGRIAVFGTYAQAASAVRDGHVEAYASVARAHSGFIQQTPDWGLDVITVPSHEKAPAFGSFAFGREDQDLVQDVNAVLSEYLGTQAHKDMVAAFGFSTADVDLLVEPRSD